MRLQLGSQGYDSQSSSTEWESKKRIPMFKVPGLYPMFMRKDGNCTGVILPAFDSTLSLDDKERATSWEPYRTEEEDKETGNRKFSGWFGTVLGYRFYGTNKSTFVSPRTIEQADPLIDIRNYLYRQLRQGLIQESYVKSLTERNQVTWTTPVPRTLSLTLLNVWASPVNELAKDKTETNQVLVLGQQAAIKLMEDLNELRPSILEVTDQDWPLYLYGDPTNPAHAIKFRQMQYTPQAKSGSSSSFSGPALNLGNTRVRGTSMTVDIEYTPITKTMLEGRYDFADLDNVLHIPSYNEIVDQLIEEELVPYDLVAKVCADKYEGSFPVKNASAPKVADNGFSAKAPYEEDEDEIPGLVPAPAPAPATVPTPEPVIAPTPADIPAQVVSDNDPEMAEYKEIDSRIRSGNCSSTTEFERYRALRAKFGPLG